MTLKSGGVLEGSERLGTYNVTGTVITASFVYDRYSYAFRCNIKENFTKMEGTWGYGASQTDGGQMLLTKQ